MNRRFERFLWDDSNLFMRFLQLFVVYDNNCASSLGSLPLHHAVLHYFDRLPIVFHRLPAGLIEISLLIVCFPWVICRFPVGFSRGFLQDRYRSLIGCSHAKNGKHAGVPLDVHPCSKQHVSYHIFV